jgi:hypothetical protein
MMISISLDDASLSRTTEAVDMIDDESAIFAMYERKQEEDDQRHLYRYFYASRTFILNCRRIAKSSASC